MDKKLKPGYIIEGNHHDIWFSIMPTKNIKTGKAEIADMKKKNLTYRLLPMRIVKIQGTVVYEVDK